LAQARREMLKTILNVITAKWRFPMLKKLVKYGNSNALIFDKAILELLNIEEGSVVKIKTDGKSIIITPHEKIESEKVSETYTNNNAAKAFMANSYLGLYKKIDESKRASIVNELEEILFQQKNITNDISNNPDFLKEWQKASKESLAKGASLVEHKKLYEDIKSNYSSGQVEINQKIKNWEIKNKLEMKEELKAQSKIDVTPDKNLQERLERMSGKYGALKAKEFELLNNPDYQHDLQRIAEKYKGSQNSLEYINDIKDLGYKYLPELKKLDEELKSV
jgi:antitoxin component of MazEF toxin-antitoxin module